MVDLAKNTSRRILAPHLWPWGPAAQTGSGDFFYISWPGWELYLSRRLGLETHPPTAKAICLPDFTDAQKDFLIIDQLAQDPTAASGSLLGGEANFRPQESTAALAQAIANYEPQEQSSSRPLLADHLYLALWTIAEFRQVEVREALVLASAQEKLMLEEVRGEDFDFIDEVLDKILEKGDEDQDSEAPPDFWAADQIISTPGRRSKYAWQCWRRLVGPYLLPADVIIPTVAEE